MKSLWKFSAIAAVAVSGSFAHADVVLPNTPTGTGSELVLFVRDISAGAATDRVYARGLGISVDNLLTAAAAGSTPVTPPVTSIAYTLPTIGPDANLSAFLGGGSQFVWTIMAADSVGTAAFSQRYVTTTQTDYAAGATLPINSALRTIWGGIQGMFGDLNGVLPDAAGSSTATGGLWGQTGTAYENATTWFAGGLQNENALGQAANLFILTNSSTTNTNSARVFAGLDVVLELNGSLHAVTPVGEVPLPPALLLLGSAFAGLAGVARRKRNDASVAA